jgi:hypothetical protein
MNSHAKNKYIDDTYQKLCKKHGIKNKKHIIISVKDCINACNKTGEAKKRFSKFNVLHSKKTKYE